MVRKSSSATQPPKPPLELNASREEAKARLQDRIEKGRELRTTQIRSPQELESLQNDFDKWNSFNVELLKRLFTNDELATEYSYWGGGVISIYERSLGEKIADTYKDIDEKIHRLDSIIISSFRSGPGSIASPREEGLCGAWSRRSSKNWTGGFPTRNRT